MQWSYTVLHFPQDIILTPCPILHIGNPIIMPDEDCQSVQSLINQVNLYQELSQSTAYWDIQLQHHVHEYKWRINYQSHCECS